MWWLRRLDAVTAWAVVWGVTMTVLEGSSPSQAGVLSVVLVCLGFFVPALRTRWRPITAAVGLAMSRGLRPGDRAWYVRARDADLVLVTARHGFRTAIASPDLLRDESMSVRRTRVLLLPADPDRMA
jgi:hypothetical protein